MSKLGCSLNEAFGESWKAGPQYYQTSPERFRVNVDPYSNNVFDNFANEDFIQERGEIEKDDERIRLLEAKVESMTKAANVIQREKPVDTLSSFSIDSSTAERIDNVVRFALISILIANFLDLLSID